ncbi:MAG TPA: hypothetical protein ENG74_01565 [Thermoplasmatales archaeon]|nr:hypothetical protein [Thermoplasmatales archaeon]
MDYLQNRLSYVVLAITLILVAYPIHAFGTGYPDLTIEKIEFTPEETIKEGDVVDICAYVKNKGDADIGSDSPISVALYVDESLQDIKTISDGLRKNRTKVVQFSWEATPGTHLIRIIADYPPAIYEEREDNNELVVEISAEEIAPDLVIDDVENLPQCINKDEDITINVTVKNLGHEVEHSFDVEFRLGTVVETVEINETLSLGEEKTLHFTFKPTEFGYFNATIKVDASDRIRESNESNNIWNRDIFVYDFLPWWNSSWHYRVPMVTERNGLANVTLNFTELMDYLGLENATLDENSIRVVEYDLHGDIENQNVSFNYTIYNGMSDSTVDLVWVAKKSRYYMAYFDVIENGNKPVPITQDINLSQNSTPVQLLLPEGWRVLPVNPKSDTVLPMNGTCNITIESVAYLNRADMEVYLDNLYLDMIHMSSNDNLTFFSGYRFSYEGNYTLKIIALDGAGYKQQLVLRIFVGKIDISILDVIMPHTFYEKTPAAISVRLKSDMAISNVVAYLNISLAGVDETQCIENISIDGETEVRFTWIPRTSGDAEIYITALAPPGVPEKNESNNVRTINVTVEKLPDIVISRIYHPEVVDEGNDLVVYAHIKCIEPINVKRCVVSLYAASNALDWSNDSRVCSKTVKIPANSIVNVTLVFKNIGYCNDGRWIIGIEALPYPSDENITNNRRIFSLQVIKAERIPPVIRRVWSEPVGDEIGYPINIYADVYDRSGISEVTLFVKRPNGSLSKYQMSMVNGTIWRTNLVFHEAGLHTCYVVCRDNSPVKNEARSSNISINILEDTTSPDILGIWIYPRIQLSGEKISIRCAIQDNGAIERANITIISPGGAIIKKPLAMMDDTWYVYEDSFNDTGKYTFYISVTDSSGNLRQSKLENFWITSDRNDSDSDGIPDWWEERYGLDPFNPDDAEGDKDKDGYTELTEYLRGLSPLQPNTILGLSEPEMAVILLITIILLVVGILSLPKRRNQT